MTQIAVAHLPEFRGLSSKQDEGMDQIPVTTAEVRVMKTKNAKRTRRAKDPETECDCCCCLCGC